MTGSDLSHPSAPLVRPVPLAGKPRVDLAIAARATAVVVGGARPLVDRDLVTLRCRAAP